MPFSNQQKGENGCRNYFMTNLHERILPDVRIEPAEDMLKSAVIEEKKFKHNPWAGADNPLGPKFLCQQPIRAKISMSTGRPHHNGHLLQV